MNIMITFKASGVIINNNGADANGMYWFEWCYMKERVKVVDLQVNVVDLSKGAGICSLLGMTFMSGDAICCYILTNK